MKQILSVLFLVVCGVASLPKSGDSKYEGARVFRVTPETLSHVHYLKLLLRTNKYDFWTEPSLTGKVVDIMATRWVVPALRETFQTAKMNFEVLIPDLYKKIVENRLKNEHALENARDEGRKMNWKAYHDYDQIMEWVDSLAATYPSLVTVENVGFSYEGRTMKLVKVSTGGSGKPAIFSDAGIHAREWISPATLTYIMNELLSNSEAYSDVLNAVDFYFMPSINPDGYAYSWTNERLWRKTRSTTGRSSWECRGVDANRNWDFHWMESGASQFPCSNTYAGPSPFSEPETRAVRDQMLKYSNATRVYFSFHSYGQYWLYPWGYDSSLPFDWRDLDDLSNMAVEALTAVHGTKYTIGGSGAVLYPASGASDDYAKGVAGIKYSYTVELRDKGCYGFLLPPSQIIPSGEETFAAFEVVMDFVKDTYGKK